MAPGHGRPWRKTDADFRCCRGMYEPGNRVSARIFALPPAHESWPEARAICIKEKAKGRFILKTPDEFSKSTTRAVAATYLLAKLQVHDSLELLLNGYKKQRGWLQEYG